MLIQEQLKDLLNYEAATGLFTWIVSPAKQVKAGAVAGSLNKATGYAQIMLSGTSYQAHRLAWLYVYGIFPTKGIDHINGIKSDNRLCNLREANQSENGMNKGIQSNNTAGFKGVSWNKATKKWQAYCKVNGTLKHLGYFLTAEAAFVAYETFAKEAHGSFYNSGEITG